VLAPHASSLKKKQRNSRALFAMERIAPTGVIREKRGFSQNDNFRDSGLKKNKETW